MNAKAAPREYFYFALIMVIFILGMIGMLIYKVENPWIWVGYILLWTWLEMKVASNIHLKWTTWLVIILALCIIDFIIIQLIH